MEFFNELGRRIERRWKAAGSDDAALAQLATEELTKAPAHENLTCDDILDWCNQPCFDLPHQHDIRASFGDPPVTVFHGADMVIDVNFWLNSTTVIHEHGFSGAFQVLSGSSVHTRYDFVEDRRYNSQIYTGELTPRPAEVLRVGDICGIEAGPTFIHALFHLERPSATVVVRTKGHRLVNIQRNFFPPGLALDPNQSQTALRNQQIAAHMIATSNPRLAGWLERYFRHAGPGDAFEMLMTLAPAWARLPDVNVPILDDLLAPSLSQVADCCWSGPLVVDAFKAEWHRVALTMSRAAIVDPDRRWFLAILLNGGKSDVYRLVQERFPDEAPISKVFGWLAELCGPQSQIGLVLNRSMLQIGRGLAEGVPIGRIADEVNATRRTPAPLAHFEEAAAELRGSALAILF